MMRTIATVIGSLLITCGFGAAHEQRLHKGRATEGQVVSLSKEGFVMQNAKEKITVTVSDSTTVERGDQKVGRDAIHAGDHVSVFGTTLATGELVAREILIATHGHEGHPGP